jgi:hypothetical protein
MTAQLRASPTPPPSPIQDPEYRTLLRLTKLTSGGIPDHPVDALQQVVELARELTIARYAALAVTDENDNIEGFVVAGCRRRRSEAEGRPRHGPLRPCQDGAPFRIDDWRLPRGSAFRPSTLI